MATRTVEQNLIDQIATEASAIDGIKVAYGFAQNPDTLSDAKLPALLSVPTNFSTTLGAHHNIRKNKINITSILFVATRQTAGGKLKYLENRAMPFLGKFRARFSDDQVTKNLFNVGNLTQAYDLTGAYGAGGPLLTFNSVEHIGIIFKYSFTEMI